MLQGQRAKMTQGKDWVTQNAKLTMPIAIHGLIISNLAFSHPKEVTVTPNINDPTTKVDAEVCFDDPIAIRKNFSKMKDIQTVYTVELIPPPPCGGSAVHVLK